MNPDHQKLIQDAIEGQLTTEQEKQLRDLMKDSAELREEYCTQALVHARLEWEMKQAETDATAESTNSFRKQSISRFVLPLSAAALLLLGLGIYQIFKPQTSPLHDLADTSTSHSQDKQPLRSVARITATEKAKWGTDGLQDLPWLFPGRVSLLEGNATLVFDSGAQVTLAAPCEFDLIGSNRGKLISGTLSANVPEPAIGFIIDTPEASITDLSTSFGVTVSKDKNEVQVFEGEVIVSYGADTSNSKLIQQSKAYALFPQQEPTAVSYTPENYPPAIAPERNTDNLDKLGHIHWSFDQLSSASYSSTGTLTQADTYPATIKNSKSPGSTQTIGRFGKALHLSGDGTFLTTQFPGIAGSGARTIAFWVRIPPNAKPQNAYSIIGWGHLDFGVKSQKWEIGWNTAQFPKNTTGTFGAIRTDFGLGHTIGSTDLRDGRWHHVASVFTGGRNADAATHIRHYVDGRLEGISAYRSQLINTNAGPQTPIPAMIGRYLQQGNKDFQSFNGSIDELYLFNAALTPAQILSLRDSNTPPPPAELITGP